MIKKLLRFLAPLYGRLLELIAYGPWGRFIHSIFIRIFRSLYRIKDEIRPEHQKLGDFFLRQKSFKIDLTSKLVSPVECHLFDGPRLIRLFENIEVKGLQFKWNEFQEFRGIEKKAFYFWNMYLAPYHYHWIHSPTYIKNFEALRIKGAKFPVNSIGRRLCPQLYAENERLSFRWQDPEMGWIYMLCVGAMGVSRLRSCIGEVNYENWKFFDRELPIGFQIAGFELGSTVLLFVENPGPLKVEFKSEISVGESLLASSSL